MKITPLNVWKILHSSGSNGLTSKELLRQLDQNKAKKAQLKKVLRALAMKGWSHKIDNAYYLTEEGLKTGGAPKPKSKSIKRKKGNVGVFLVEEGEGVVRVSGSTELFPVSRLDLQRVMHGDAVAFALLKNKKTVRITEILERRNNMLRGVLRWKKGRPVFIPSNKNIQHHFLVKDSKFLTKNQIGAKAVLQITRYPASGSMGEGHINLVSVPQLDEAGALEKILKKHKIPLEFPAKVLKEGKSIPTTVRLIKSEKRNDLRHLPFVTIDGADAKDFDDAIYAEKDKMGYRIWVAIADVADYVIPGSETDGEARLRGTSVYTPKRVFPMLPEALSNGVCSLKPGVNRKTLTCEILLDKKGVPLQFQIYESLIRSAARLTYEEVDHFFETEKIRKGSPELADCLLLYRKISEILQKKRVEKGMIRFNFPETTFVYNQNNGLIDIRKTYSTPANKLIEQFMLEANENVGLFCMENELSILWRNHLPPSPQKLSTLQKLFHNAGARVSFDGDKVWNKALDQLEEGNQKNWLEYNLLRSMSQADYDSENQGHFGLASSHYCHFTSPIRRYPDLLVHRTLKNFLRGNAGKQLSASDGNWTSKRERVSDAVERETRKLQKMLFIAERMGENFQVKVSGVHWNGLFVEIESPFVEGFVPLTSLTDDHYLLIEEKHMFIGTKRKKRIRVGEPLEVCLARLDWKNLQPEFEWIDWKTPIDSTGNSV